MHEHSADRAPMCVRLHGIVAGPCLRQPGRRAAVVQVMNMGVWLGGIPPGGDVLAHWHRGSLHVLGSQV